MSDQWYEMNEEAPMRVQFTLMDAVRLGHQYIRRRLDRSLINIASIALGLSFYTTMVISDLLYSTSARLGGGQVAVESYQYWLVAVALVVSIVGITNAMLIAVYERYREIGTMKCIGALDRHILLLFLVEAFVQGAIGGVAGFLLGVLGALLSAGFTTGFGIVTMVPATEYLLFLGGSTILSIVLSMTATVYPAFRAARLNPVEALSYEL
jgi:hypothetical protein